MALSDELNDLAAQIGDLCEAGSGTWHEHMAPVHKGAEERGCARPETAQQAADDAAYAIYYAYAAIEEAHYVVLAADLAHRHADELAQA
jgi:hypothetical protein